MKHTAERFGIAFGWRTLPDGRFQSQIRMRVLLRELLTVGFAEPLMLTAKSTLTSDLLKALAIQYEVLDAIDHIRHAAGKPSLHAPFYACSIPLGPGAEAARGSAQVREMVPMVAHIPAPVTKDYILAHWPTKEWVTHIEQLLDATIAWSISESAAIADGSDLLEHGE